MKKQLPLAIRKTLEQILEENRGLIYAEKNENGVMTFRDKDPASDFYFMIEKITVQGNKTSYTIDYVPTNQANLVSQRIGVNLNDLTVKMKHWINLLVEYNKESILFDDDPISRSYYEEMQPIFEIIDEDADRNPFNYSQQKKLGNLYDEVIQMVLDETSDDNKTESDLIISEIEKSKKLISKSTKSQVVEKLRKNLTALRKFSLQVFEKTLVKYLSDIGKKMISGEIDLLSLLP